MGLRFPSRLSEIAEIRELLPGVPILALTATATRVVKDIRPSAFPWGKMCFPHEFRTQKFVGTRPSKTENKTGAVASCAVCPEAPSHLCARNRRQPEITELLHNEGITADFYHAGLTMPPKTSANNAGKTGESRVMVATNAFWYGYRQTGCTDCHPHGSARFHRSLLPGSGTPEGTDKKPTRSSFTPSRIRQHVQTHLTPSWKEYIKEVYDIFTITRWQWETDKAVYASSIEDFCRKFKYFPRSRGRCKIRHKRIPGIYRRTRQCIPATVRYPSTNFINWESPAKISWTNSSKPFLQAPIPGSSQTMLSSMKIHAGHTHWTHAGVLNSSSTSKLTYRQLHPPQRHHIIYTREGWMRHLQPSPCTENAKSDMRNA